MQSQVSLVERGRGRFDTEAEGNVTAGARCCFWRWREGAGIKDARNVALETGKCKEIDSPLELTEGAGPYWHLDFGPGERISDFGPPEM